MLASPATAVSSFLVREPGGSLPCPAGDASDEPSARRFRRCPQLFRRKRTGLIPDEDRPAYLVGRAAHTAILEGRDAFQDSFAVGGPINPKTGQPYGVSTKTWTEWAEAQGKPVLTPAHTRVGAKP